MASPSASSPNTQAIEWLARPLAEAILFGSIEANGDSPSRGCSRLVANPIRQTYTKLGGNPHDRNFQPTWVVGTHKITSNLDEALRRLREHCVPLEDKRMKSLGAPGTVLSKILIYEKESHPQTIFNVRVILVNEPLGF
jgi:hypothetical protein